MQNCKEITIGSLCFDNVLLFDNLNFYIAKAVIVPNSFFLMSPQHLYPAVAEPRCFSTTFYNLKSLKLFTGIDKCYIRSIIYLLKCAPNLQLLSVYIDEEEVIFDL